MVPTNIIETPDGNVIGNCKPNSHKYKESQKAAEQPEKKVKKVVQGAVKTRKKNELRKLGSNLIAVDANDIKKHLISDVAIPTVKKLLYDIFVGGLGMALFGEDRADRHGGGSRTTKVSYRSFYDDRRPSEPTNRSRSRFDVDDLVFETRGEAAAVIDQMGDLIDAYGHVTVADLYDMVDLTAPYTSNNYGWYSIKHVDIGMTRDGGYVLKLPRATVIERN